MSQANSAVSPSAISTREKIISQLERTFSPVSCQLDDESSMHIGHAGAASGGGHFNLVLVSKSFEGLNLVNRHRLVYDAVREMMQSEIHALAITALTPEEAARKAS
jgi:BolA protein